MIDAAALGFALGAGLVAGLNPCGFAFLPGYLGLVIAASRDTSRPVALVRAAVATVVMATGFLTVFAIFGLAVSPLIASAQRYLPFATVVVGVALLAMGVWLLAGREISLLLPSTGGTPTARLGSMYGYGVGYAVASLSCTIAPFLAVISTTFRQGSTVAGVLAFVAYAAGMSTTVGVAALAVAVAGSAAGSALRRVLPYVGRIAGLIVLLSGLYVSYYGYYEIRLYFAGSDADDPVVGPVVAVQSWFADRVEALGVWPLLGAIGALTAGVLGRRALSRRSGPTPE